MFSLGMLCKHQALLLELHIHPIHQAFSNATHVKKDTIYFYNFIHLEGHYRLVKSIPNSVTEKYSDVDHTQEDIEKIVSGFEVNPNLEKEEHNDVQ